MSTFALQNPRQADTDDPPVSATAKYLLGGAGLLQAALGGLGFSNGGIATLAINEPVVVAGGGVCVLFAVMIGAVSVAGIAGKVTPPPWLGYVGLAFLFGGLALAGYAALVVPTLTNSPNISVTFTNPAAPSHDLGLAAEVKATAIGRDTLYFVEIDGLTYVHGAKRYRAAGPPLYLGQFGADNSGKIDAKVNMAVPQGNYSAISVQAWYGKHSGPCQSLVANDSASAGTARDPIVQDNTGREGCVLVRVPRT